MNIGERLFELRKSKNLTQDEVAEKLNITRQTVSKWETNQSTPDFDKILPLCELYNITANELLMEDANIEKDKNSNSENCNEKIKDKNNYENMTSYEIKVRTTEVIMSSIFMIIIAVVIAVMGIAVWKINPIIISCLFLILVAIAIMRMIKHTMLIPKTVEKNENLIVHKITDIVNIVGTIIYFIISFITMAWHITWIIFIVIKLVNEIIKLIFTLKEVKENE